MTFLSTLVLIFGTLQYLLTSPDTTQLSVLNLNQDQVTLNPKENWFGIISLNIEITNGILTKLDTMQVEVLSVNDAPLSQNVPFENLIEDQEYFGTISAEDIEQGPIRIQLNLQVQNGVISFIDNSSGYFNYVPEPNFFGLDSFSYVISDGEDTSIEYTTTLMIEGVNDAPLSQNMLLDDLIEDTEYLGTLQGEDLEEDRITFFITIEPNHGTFRFIEGLGNYSYIPDDNFFGLDSFFYEISDGEDTSIEYKTTLNINGVNDVPTSENTIFNDVIEDAMHSGIIFGNDIENDPINLLSRIILTMVF